MTDALGDVARGENESATGSPADPPAVAECVTAALRQLGSNAVVFLLPNLVAWLTCTLLLIVAMQMPLGWLYFLVLPLPILIIFAAEAVTVQLAIDSWGRRPATLAYAARVLRTRALPRYVGTRLLTYVVTLVGLMLFVVPGVLFFVRRGFLAGVVALTEERSGWAALRRGAELSGGQRPWRFVASSVGLYDLALLVTMVVFGVLAGALGVEDTSDFEQTSETISSILYSVWLPFDALVASWLYIRRTGGALAQAQRPQARAGVLVPTVLCGLFLVQLPFCGKSWIESYWLPGGSMIPTLHIGDHVYVNKVAYGLTLPIFGTVTPTENPQRGEIVVFRSPNDGTELMKRVVAIEGDEVEIVAKQVHINGEVVHEPYAVHADRKPRRVPGRDDFGPVVVPPGHFFALGDNRDYSHDSRFWGFARVDDLVGRTIDFVYWSRPAESWLPNWRRFGPVFHWYETASDYGVRVARRGQPQRSGS